MKNMEQIFELTSEEANSVVWNKLSAHLRKKLATYRLQNDGNLDAEQTARLRGKIALAKELLGIDPALESTDRLAGGE